MQQQPNQWRLFASLQRRVLTELCRLRNVPDNDVADRDAALAALRGLKTLAVQLDLYAEEEKSARTDRRAVAEERERVCAERAKKLKELRGRFNGALFNPNRQQASYFLEELLYELFSLFGVDYRKPYKTETNKSTDTFHSRVLITWLNPGGERINLQFKKLAASRPKSTASLRVPEAFLLNAVIRAELVAQFQGRGCNIIFVWDGADLIEVLEGRVDLRDGMKFKIEKAAQEGKALVSLRDSGRRSWVVDLKGVHRLRNLPLLSTNCAVSGSDIGCRAW